MAKSNETQCRALIVKACHALAAKSLVAATDGNVSARLDDRRLLVTPSGISKAEIRAEDLLICDFDGKNLSNNGCVTTEVNIHIAAYRARPEVGGVVHAHPPVATAFTFAGCEHLLRAPVVPEVAVQIGPIFTVPYHTPGTRELAEAAGPFFKSSDIVMLGQHGAVALGADPWRAYLRMEKLEHFASILKHARELAGGDRKLRRLSAAQVAAAKASYGRKKG